MPDVLTLIVLPVAFVLHLMLPVQPVAVNVAVSELHKLVLFVDMIGATGETPVLITMTLFTPLSPQLLLHVAV